MIMNMGEKKGNSVKCVIVGDGAVGKTSMLLSYTTGGILMDYIPTCFDCYTVDMKVRETSYSMSVIDTAGQETYDRLRTLSYYDTDVFVVCFSIADDDSFQNIKHKWIPEIRQYRPDTPFILVGTQSDHRKKKPKTKSSHSRFTCSYSTQTSVTSAISDSGSQKETVHCVPMGKARTLSHKCGAHKYMECSALAGEGIADVFAEAMLAAVTPKKKRTPSFIKSIKSVFKSRRSHASEAHFGE